MPSPAITSVRSKMVRYRELAIWWYWEVSNPYFRLPKPCWVASENATRMAIGPRKKTV